MADLTHLSLFSGIGGLDIAAEWAGFRTVGQCEWADYPRAVLEKHWPGLPRWRDIRTLTGDSFYEQTGLRTVTVLSGGFPCQPFSTAGKRRGKEDDRYLWPEMLRVIQEIRPRWVVGENVAGIVTLALDTVLSDLESIGYTCQAFIIPACAVDAPHRRDRCAILAHADGERCSKQHHAAFSDCAWLSSSATDENKITFSDCNNGSGPLRRECALSAAEGSGNWGGNNLRRTPEYGGREWWPVEPDVGRVAHGVPARVDRLKCLGNAVVPQQFYPIFRGIAELEGLYGTT